MGAIFGRRRSPLEDQWILASLPVQPQMKTYQQCAVDQFLVRIPRRDTYLVPIEEAHKTLGIGHFILVGSYGRYPNPGDGLFFRPSRAFLDTGDINFFRRLCLSPSSFLSESKADPHGRMVQRFCLAIMGVLCYAVLGDCRKAIFVKELQGLYSQKSYNYEKILDKYTNLPQSLTSVVIEYMQHDWISFAHEHDCGQRTSTWEYPDEVHINFDWTLEVGRGGCTGGHRYSLIDFAVDVLTGSEPFNWYVSCFQRESRQPSSYSG